MRSALVRVLGPPDESTAVGCAGLEQAADSRVIAMAHDFTRCMCLEPVSQTKTTLNAPTAVGHDEHDDSMNTKENGWGSS
jgi:hypothetical protein